MANLLQAISNIIHSPILDVVSYYRGRNRINAVGDALEAFIKDAFANTLNSGAENTNTYSQVFSYIGNANNPPDLILKDGDAIEVKKIESLKSQIALNSSYPKSKILSNDPMITNACRNCEDISWTEKDIIYTIGVIRENKLKLIWFIYGDCYAADKQIVKNGICDGINQIQDIEFAETNELGRVNKVDPLGITYLRIRGMWGMENPLNVYDYVDLGYDAKNGFQIIAIMKASKYQSFPVEIRREIENLSGEENFEIMDRQIRSPDNPAKLINAKIISYKR